jgi:DNA-binding CsgD family transcriptional regulator
MPLGRGSPSVLGSTLFFRLQGNPVFTPQKRKALFASLGLPKQEAAIAGLVMDGRPDKEIAAEMGIALPTVRTYMTRLFRRLHVSGRAGLISALFLARCEQCRHRCRE